MTKTYTRGEIVWAKIQGYSWWPGRIIKIKLRQHVEKNEQGKIILKYDNGPYFYISFFPNYSIGKVRSKNIEKFLESYKKNGKETKKRNLQKAIDKARSTYLKEFPNLSNDIKNDIFQIKLFSTKKFNLFRKINDENSENSDNIEDSDENKKKRFLGMKKREPSFSEEDSISNESESEENPNKTNIKYTQELKKLVQDLYKANIEIKRKNAINNIMSIFEKIENIINNQNIDYSFFLVKDLLNILNNYSTNNNETLMEKSILLYNDLLKKLMDNLFIYNENLLENDEINLNNDTELESQLTLKGNEILLLIEQNKNKSGLANKTEKIKNNIIENLNKSNSDEDTININNISDNKIITGKPDLIPVKINNGNKNLKKLIDEKNKLIIPIHNEDQKKVYSEEFNKLVFENDIQNNKHLAGRFEAIENSIKNIEIETGSLNSFANGFDFGNNSISLFLKDIINNENFFGTKLDGKLYPDNFFKEIYLKGGITPEVELLRKKLCLQLYGILKLVLPFCQDDIFKKNVIFLEYLARYYDPTFGNKYKIIINMIYNRIKTEVIKIKNRNITN